jgi:ATP-dependent Zn protease
MNKAAFFCSRLLVLALVLGATNAGAMCSEKTRQALVVQDVSTGFAERYEGQQPDVVTIGKIRNTSAYVLDDIQAEVQYFNAEKQLIDVSRNRLYFTKIEPGGEVAFRVREAALHPKSAYVSQEVRLSLCDPEKNPPPRKPQQSQDNWFTSLLVDWFPMLLLIACWIFFMRRCSGSKSPTIRILERQLDLTEQQNKTLERIAIALEEKNQRNQTP